VAEDFAANLGSARLIVRKNTARRRQDGDAKPVIDARQVTDAVINTTTWAGYALDLRDHRLTLMIFQLNLQFPNTWAHIDT
jgi:hypothetical protein